MSARNLAAVAMLRRLPRITSRRRAVRALLADAYVFQSGRRIVIELPYEREDAA